MQFIMGVPGTRKTIRQLERMVRTPGRYLFANPTTDLIHERVGDLQRMARELGTDPLIVEVHAKVRHSVYRQVARTIAALPDEMASVQHIVVLVTHEGLISSDLSAFDGWVCVVDEVPSCIATGTLRIPASYTFFEAAYELRDGLDGWSRVVARASAPSYTDLHDDDLLSSLVTFHRRALSPAGVYVDITEWEDARVSGRVVNWLSVWTLHDLAAAPFSDVVLIGSGILHSLTYLVSSAIAPVQMERVVMPLHRNSLPRVRIEYFAKAHRGSTAWWRDGVGRSNLLAIRRYLEAQEVGYWSGNEDVTKFFFGSVPGAQMRPKIAGSNNLLHHTSCAMIYSSKATPEDAILTEAFGITAEQIERAREVEDIWQFIWRGALRCAEFSGEYVVWVHDEAQATTLAEMLRQSGVTSDVVLRHVELTGFADVIRASKPGRPPVHVGTAAEIAAAKRRANAEAARRYREKTKSGRAA